MENVKSCRAYPGSDFVVAIHFCQMITVVAK